MIFRIVDNVAGGGGIVFLEMNTYYVLFAAAMIAAAKSPEIKAPFNNNLPSQTKGGMVNSENPENPDSKSSCCAHHPTECPTLKNLRNPVNPDSKPGFSAPNPLLLLTPEGSHVSLFIV